MKTIIILGNDSSKPDAEAIRNSRISCALSLYTPGDIIIVSGADVGGVGETEALIMSRLIPYDVILEQNARNTVENIVNSMKLIRTNEVVWVSSSYHCPRIRLLLDFMKIGGDVVGADYGTRKRVQEEKRKFKEVEHWLHNYQSSPESFL